MTICTYIYIYTITTSDAQSDPPKSLRKVMRLPAANVLEKLRNIRVLLRKKSGFLGSHGPRQCIANLAGSANESLLRTQQRLE